MSAKIKPYKPEYIANDTPKIKKLELRFPVTERTLERRVKIAFDLAKSAGHELDLTFSHATF